MKRIYIAGPMSGLPELNFPAFHAAAAKLRAAGYEVVSPAEVNVPHPGGWQLAMRADIAELVKCEAITFLRGWRRSKGAKLEARIAAALGMETIPMPSESHPSKPERAKGGHARAANLSPERRREIASMGRKS